MGMLGSLARTAIVGYVTGYLLRRRRHQGTGGNVTPSRSGRTGGAGSGSIR